MREYDKIPISAEVVEHPMMSGIFAYTDEPDHTVAKYNDVFPYIGKKVRVVPSRDMRELSTDYSRYSRVYMFASEEDMHRYNYYMNLASFLPQFGRTQSQTIQLTNPVLNEFADVMVDQTPIGMNPREYWMRILGVRQIPLKAPKEQLRGLHYEVLKRLPEPRKIKTDVRFVPEAEVKRQTREFEEAQTAELQRQIERGE